jgi:hypothetical protein
MNSAKLALTLCIITPLALLSSPSALESDDKPRNTNQRVTLRLVWDRSFPDGIVTVAFNEDRAGIFCPSIVVEGKAEWSKAILFLDGNGDQYKKIELAPWSQVRISRNGKFIGIMHPEKHDKELHYGPVAILNAAGDSIRRFGEVYGSGWGVSPTGREIACREPFSDDDIIYFTGINGERTANLSKGEGNILLFDGMPAAKWADTDNGYLQIGDNGVFCSSNGRYVALPKYVQTDSGSVAHLILYTHDGIPLKDFDLGVSRSLFASFSDDGRYLVVAVKNLVFLIDVTDTKILWLYESDDRYQVLNRSSRIDFCLEPFYVAGVFHHHRHSVYGERDERLIIFSADGEVIADTVITKVLDKSGTTSLKVSKTGDMICYVTGQRIRVFQLSVTE